MTASPSSLTAADEIELWQRIRGCNRIVGPDNEVFFSLAFLLGWRIKDLRFARWNQVSLDRREIRFERVRAGKLVIVERPLPPRAIDILAAHRRSAQPPGGRIFTTQRAAVVG